MRQVESLAQSLCEAALAFGEEGKRAMVRALALRAPLRTAPPRARHCAVVLTVLEQARPYGVALLLAGWDETGPQL